MRACYFGEAQVPVTNGEEQLRLLRLFRAAARRPASQTCRRCSPARSTAPRRLRGQRVLAETRALMESYERRLQEHRDLIEL